MVELYTGELFFDTHENLEHLGMIEKQCGPLPQWMAVQSCNTLQRHLHTSPQFMGPRLKQNNQCAESSESIRRVKQMLLLDDIILDEFGADHVPFKNLITSMLVIDRDSRPTATDCLKHPFFH